MQHECPIIVIVDNFRMILLVPELNEIPMVGTFAGMNITSVRLHEI